MQAFFGGNYQTYHNTLQNWLQDIKRLFLDLFELIFHQYDVFLNFSIIGLGTDRIDFSTYFLTDKSQFFFPWLFSSFSDFKK